MGTPPSPGQRASFYAALLLLSLALPSGLRDSGKLLAPTRSRPPNLLLITLDTLRPDALGWVSGRNQTPAIDRLAAEGFRFSAAVSPAPLTLPSHGSILTGFLPRRLGPRDNGEMLGSAPVTLAEALRQRGYATAAFVSGFSLASVFGLDRGFEVYDDRLNAGREGELERRAPDTTGAALAWLGSARSPWFAWVHYYDPHYPYEPPPVFGRPGWRGAYDGEVAYVDQAVGELRRGIERLGSRDRLTLFTGDHGESLGEHGEGTHGFFVYDSTMLVPLIVHFPGRIGPGWSPEPARLIDVAPTVLDLLGLPPLPGVDGVSLVPTLLRRKQKIPPAYLETYQPWTSYGWSPLKAIRHAGWKLIIAPRKELYHLEDHPAEERNLLDQNRGKARELQELLSEVEALPEAGSRIVDQPEVLARLRALGYVGGGGVRSKPPAGGLRDPKDCRDLRDLLTEADRLLRRGDYRASVSRFDAVLTRDPENRFAILRSGFALARLGDFQGALPRLEKAVQLDPAKPEARSALAEALTRAGRYSLAVEQWMEAIRLQPRRAEVWSNLGTALGLGGRLDEAVSAFARACELERGDATLLAKLAFAEHAAGRMEAAARHLQQAAEAAGESFAYSGALGILLLQLGRREEARAWLSRSRPAEGDFAEARLQLAILEAGAGRREQARGALREALSALPRLRARAEADPRLAPLLR